MTLTFFFFQKGNVSNRGFGNLFKKKQRSKSVDKKVNAENISSLFSNNTPIHADKEEKFELPPLLLHQPSISQPAPKQLQNYKPEYHHYEVKEQPPLATKPIVPINNSRWSNASTRKSTGSYSIYSTFGSESIYGENESAENVTAATSVSDINETDKNDPVDLVHIVASNVQTRNPARLVTTVESEEEDEDEYDEDDDDDDDEDEDDEIGEIQNDVFVDATGISQDDMERERTESRLSKRLSGGHFGSAGGLMVSIMVSNSSEIKKQQRRTSRPPPEDVVQSMMNWKRHSGQILGKSMMDQPQKELTEESPPTVPQKDICIQQISEKALPAPPQRSLPPNPEILLSTTEGEEEHKEVENVEEKIPNDSHETDNSSDPKECALKLWHEDENFVQRERIAEWLGQR